MFLLLNFQISLGLLNFQGLTGHMGSATGATREYLNP